MTMKPILYLLLLSAAACGVKHSSVDYGKTTASDLIATRGEPLEEKKIPITNGKVFLYEDNQQFQIKNDVVTHGFKDPKGDQKTILYWKHQFRECDTTTRQISSIKGHELPEYELKCPAQGITVIYTEGSEFVSRIIEHEKK